MTEAAISHNQLNRVQIGALLIGLVGLAVALVAALLGSPARFFQSYLFSYLFWIGLSLGSLALVMFHHTVGGRWGWLIRGIVEAGSRTLWIMPILFLPLLFGLEYLYVWTLPGAAADPIIQQKSFYLNVPFFIIRLVIYFGIWLLLTYLFNRGRVREDDPADPNRWVRYRGLGALGLILYVLTMTFAATDWIMSLEPLWVSSIFGILIIMSQVVSGLAFALVLLPLISRLWFKQTFTYPAPVPYKDLGTLLLAFVMGWAYLAFFQFLIIWTANLPREVFWYLERSEGGWLYVAILAFLFQFAFPFMVLIFAPVKRNATALALLGLLILPATLLGYFWHVIPAFSPGVLSIHWMDIVIPVAMGGIWMAAFLFMLRRRPVLPYAEPGLLERNTDGQRYTPRNEEHIPG